MHFYKIMVNWIVVNKVGKNKTFTYLYNECRAVEPVQELHKNQSRDLRWVDQRAAAALRTTTPGTC